MMNVGLLPSGAGLVAVDVEEVGVALVVEIPGLVGTPEAGLC